jgi:two-component system NtrC family sensor kinase
LHGINCGRKSRMTNSTKNALREDMPAVLTRFDLPEMLRSSNGLTKVMRGAPSMEAAAREQCRYLYDELRTITGDRACVLVRCYKTHPYGELPPDLQRFARRQLESGTLPSDEMRCLVLLGTVGDEASWNDRRRSAGHQAVPLPSASVVERAPMIAQLFRALGIDLAKVVTPSTSIVHDLEGKSYGVFHVRDARNSQYIPAQDFVEHHQVRAVVGFGGSLKTGDYFATILFTRTTVTTKAADRFRTLALYVKSRFFDYGPDEVFDSARGRAPLHDR